MNDPKSWVVLATVSVRSLSLIVQGFEKKSDDVEGYFEQDSGNCNYFNTCMRLKQNQVIILRTK